MAVNLYNWIDKAKLSSLQMGLFLGIYRLEIETLSFHVSQTSNYKFAYADKYARIVQLTFLVR